MSGSTISFPLSAWVALASVGIECAGAGYARAPATFELTEDGVTAANVAVIQWAEALSAWGTIDAIYLYDAATAGNRICELVPYMLVTINQYDRVEIPPCGIEVVATTVPVPSGYGIFTFGIGRYATADAVAPAGASIGSPYGAGPYSYGAYERIDQSVLLLKTWAPVALCGGEPADWSPHGPFEIA